LFCACPSPLFENRLCARSSRSRSDVILRSHRARHKRCIKCKAAFWALCKAANHQTGARLEKCERRWRDVRCRSRAISGVAVPSHGSRGIGLPWRGERTSIPALDLVDDAEIVLSMTQGQVGGTKQRKVLCAVSRCIPVSLKAHPKNVGRQLSVGKTTGESLVVITCRATDCAQCGKYREE